jgi:AMP deaminase
VDITLTDTYKGSFPQDQASGHNSSRLGSSLHADPAISDGEDEYDYENEREHGDPDSEESSDGQQEIRNTVRTETIGDGEVPGDGIPQDGMLPRDHQRKTAYYDYLTEKQMSQADMKLFYQRSQLETQKTGGSNWGSQHSAHGSPVIRTRTFSGMESIEGGNLLMSSSMHSIPGTLNMAQR